MSPLAIGALGLGALLTLILAQVPIGFAMMIVGRCRRCIADQLECCPDVARE